VYFAKHLLRYDVHRYQATVLRDDHPTTVWVAGRGAGKTYTAVTLALWKCYTILNYVVIYIAGRMQQARYAGDVALEMLQGTPLADDIVDQSSERIRFSNGATKYLVPGGNPLAARGWHNRLSRDGSPPPGVLVVLDEAATISRETRVAALGIVNTAPPGKGKLLEVGSPLGTNHWFFSEFTAGLDATEKHTASFQTPSTACPHIDQTRLAEWRAKMTPVEYGAEILAEFQESLDSYFGEFVAGAVTTYSLPVRPVSGLQYALGVDLSSSTRVGSDFTVLVVGARFWGSGHSPEYLERDKLPQPEPFIRICEILRFQYASQADLKRELKALCEKYPALYSGIVESYESTQLESFCRVVEGGEERSHGTGEVPLTLERVVASNPAQREAFGHAHQLMRDGILELPSDGPNVKQLLAELKGFTYRLTDTGNLTFGAADGGKDDVVYATAWMLWALRHRNIRPPRGSYVPPVAVAGSFRTSYERPDILDMEVYHR
jgi:hypothetical protein